ncbi:FUSC family protein [Rhodanobacter sp. B2A1Ga4]|uniref:FUSC family protein n=1 Tax=Rhodanobacter sp. B2A1Ga4 TaxID=2778647 RepID=UPI001B38BD9A|nr:FUSC family protein [Rhodanobacter sp. B2A1Ga4]MBQ4855947.1 FUSC family protein [Rhodanobacter sp. B2A1Ga4]
MSASAIESMPRLSRWPWLADVLAGEGHAWIFVLKAALALYAATWLAMWLQLEKPSTTMITVVLLMHPQSGMVLAKSFYRAIGTLAGSVFGVLLLALFPQQRVLFLLSLSLWVALCAGGATLYRNFMSYGFVLAGYSAAIVTMPAVANPLDVFDSAVMRVSEVLLGVIVAGAVSDLVLPGRLREVLRRSAREQFSHFLDFARNSTGGAIARAEMEQAYLRFVRGAVQLENLRAAVIFEDPEARARSSRMRLINQFYMSATTTFQSVHHLINRLQRSGRGDAAAALIALYQPIGAALSPPSAQQHDPAVLAPRLHACEQSLPVLAQQLRAALPEPARIDFDTGAILLRRFADELHDFTLVENSLRAKRLRGNVERVQFRRGNDYAGAGLAVLRTFLTMITLSAFWLASDWPHGASAMLIATIFAGLLAMAPNPVTVAFRTLFAQGTGMAMAFLVTFGLLPSSDGYVMFVAATLPFLILGFYVQAQTAISTMGVGYGIGFVASMLLTNRMNYDPASFINEAMAQLAGFALCAVAFMVLPAVTGTGWQRERQMRQLRRQVVLAASAPLTGLLHAFESVNRDLFLQVVTHTRPDSRESRDLLAWALTVHECGRGLIELRQDMAGSQLPGAVEQHVQQAVLAVAQLFDMPDAANWQRAELAVTEALAGIAGGPFAAQAGSRRVLLHLHRLRSVLRDDESALAPYMPAAEEPVHAS